MNYSRQGNILIGLKGKAGSGKSLSASLLSRILDAKIYNMADPLKQIGLAFGFKEKEMYGTQEDKLAINKIWNISGREFLQKFGTDICREFLPTKIPSMTSPWITLFEKFLEENKNYSVVVGDVRFEDEAECIHKNGGIIIELIRGDNDEEWTVIDKHISENCSFPVDYTIINNGTIDQLCNELYKIVIMSYKPTPLENYNTINIL